MTTHEIARDQSRIWRHMMIAAGLVLAAEVMLMGLGHSNGVKALLIPTNPKPPSGPQYGIVPVVAPNPTPPSRPTPTPGFLPTIALTPLPPTAPVQQPGQSASPPTSQSAAAPPSQPAQQPGQSASQYFQALSYLAALAASAPPAFGLQPVAMPPPAPVPVVPPPTTTTTTVPPTTTTTTGVAVTTTT